MEGSSNYRQQNDGAPTSTPFLIPPRNAQESIRSHPPQVPSRSTPLHHTPYHMGYGGYGGGHGGMYPNNFQTGFGYHGSSMVNNVEDATRGAFSSVESVIQAFSSVSMMLESTLFAVQNSIRAMANVADQMGNVRESLENSLLSFLRTLKFLTHKFFRLLRLRHTSHEDIWESSSSKEGTNMWPLALFFAVVVGTPYVMWKVMRSVLSRNKPNNNWQQGSGEHFLAEVKHSYTAQRNDELMVVQGDVIRVAPKACQPRIRGWLLAAREGKKGLVPANYLEIKGKKSPSIKEIPEANDDKISLIKRGKSDSSENSDINSSNKTDNLKEESS